jgi:CHAD domain-containing protein
MRGAASDVEIEWQLDALDLRPVERWLAAAGQLLTLVGDGTSGAGPSAVVAVARGAERLVDTYLDTADWRMARSGHVLRVRHRAGRDEITLKDTAPAQSGLRRRLEVTEPLPAEGVSALGTSGPVGWRLRALVGRRALGPVLEVRTRRRPYDLRVADERVAEVALDETTIVVGDEHQPVRIQRVEVEAVPAWVEPLKPLVDTLRRETGLRPATLSKFEAGLLAAGVQIPGPPDLGSTALGPSPTVGDVTFAVLRRQFAVMLANEWGTRLGEDPEALHDMRVATRRLRAALSQFAQALPVRAHHVRNELGWLADALGAVRDLDVQLDRLDEWQSEVPAEDRAALADLARLLHRQRDEARERLLEGLDSARYERLVAAFTTMLRQGPSRRSAAARAPAVTAVPELVATRHRAATKAARRARRSGDPDDFHRLRIRAKRLRYSLEFVSEIYDGHTTKYVRSVVKLQDTLGLMQDARVAATRLHELATAPDTVLSPTTVFVMGGFAERYRHEAEVLAHKVPARLTRLSGGAWRRLAGHMEHRRLEFGSLFRWPGAPGSAGDRPSSPHAAPAAVSPPGRGDGAIRTPAPAPATSSPRSPWVRDPVPAPPSRHPSGPPRTPTASASAPSSSPPRREAIAPRGAPPSPPEVSGARSASEREPAPPSTNGEGPGSDDRR